ncbi:50S ribosomal protein L22 [Fimbriiglobus ruber]|uniref:Large ribosomal subunit protein uL22 n=1 Tax=Fimbriiglobus ruber TaxID=1908690 RepID=A0A225D5Y8_9BACT|nr:LSU ribosomal protein L22p (L17e) [Fimbriiglobus ruber]
MFYKAKHRFADVSPRKMRPFAQLIRGKNVDEAIEALRFYPNRGARLIEAVVKSAIGNAEDQGCRDLEELVVTECRIDGGPMFKRIRPRARGTAFGIKRRLAHIIVTLTDIEAMETAIEAEATRELADEAAAASTPALPPASHTPTPAATTPATETPPAPATPEGIPPAQG